MWLSCHESRPRVLAVTCVMSLMLVVCPRLNRLRPIRFSPPLRTWTVRSVLTVILVSGGPRIDGSRGVNYFFRGFYLVYIFNMWRAWHKGIFLKSILERPCPIDVIRPCLWTEINGSDVTKTRNAHAVVVFRFEKRVRVMSVLFTIVRSGLKTISMSAVNGAGRNWTDLGVFFKSPNESFRPFRLVKFSKQRPHAVDQWLP